MTSDEFLVFLKQKNRRIDKKFFGKPNYIIQHRVCNTACDIVKRFADVEFDDLDLNLYIMCQNVGYKEFSHKYESCLEYAFLKPDKFVDELYKFFNDTARYIKKNNLISNFYLFFSTFEELAYNYSGDRESSKYKVFISYMDLLSEQVEFLRPNLFSINQLVVGVTTDDELITQNDPFPNLDVPGYEIVRQPPKSIDDADKLYKKYGYDLATFDKSHAQSNFHINNINLLVPFINEYTYDMVPSVPYMPFLEEKYVIGTKDTDFTDMLQRRKRTLPANGLSVTFEGSKFIKSMLLKEVYYNQSIHLLCKFETEQGDVTVRYNTRTKQFFSPFDYSFKLAQSYHDSIKQITLWVYSAYVCPSEDLMPTNEAYHEFADDPDAVVTFASIGGKLRTTLDKTTNGHLDYEKYQEKTISIAGYIRKLPTGQKASEKKKELAELLGLELKDNETYVEGFVRTSWVLKEPKE